MLNGEMDRTGSSGRKVNVCPGGRALLTPQAAEKRALACAVWFLSGVCSAVVSLKQARGSLWCRGAPRWKEMVFAFADCCP